jgi:hypothetical protein
VHGLERFSRKRREGYVDSSFTVHCGRHVRVLFLSCSTNSNDQTIASAPYARCATRPSREQDAARCDAGGGGGRVVPARAVEASGRRLSKRRSIRRAATRRDAQVERTSLMLGSFSNAARA